VILGIVVGLARSRRGAFGFPHLCQEAAQQTSELELSRRKHVSRGEAGHVGLGFASRGFIGSVCFILFLHDSEMDFSEEMHEELPVRDANE
jgi:hypothetical protein